MQLAPEIMARRQQSAAVDVWGLGRVVLELLAFANSSEDGHYDLHTLAVSMVQNAPERRPTIETVFECIQSLI